MNNLENIKLNHPYRYWELCYELGEEEMKGDSKYAQYKRWTQRFEWRTEGNTKSRRFIVTKIYKEVEIKQRTVYEVDGKIFNSLKEADEYRKSL